MSGPENERIDETDIDPIEHTHTQKMQRVQPGDPEQCAGVGRTSGDQCIFKRVEGTKGCLLHGGSMVAAQLKKTANKLYDLQQFRAKMDRLEGGGTERASRLIEEQSILRMTLESLLQKSDAASLHSDAAKIGLLVREIRETLKVDTGIKKQLGELLDKAVLSKLCDSLVTIIQKRIPATEMDTVVLEVAQALNDAVIAARSSDS